MALAALVLVAALSVAGAVMMPALSGSYRAAGVGEPVPTGVPAASTGPVTGSPDEEGYIRVAGDGTLSLFVNPETTVFFIEDGRSGARWYSCPPRRMSDPYAAGIYKMEMSSLFVVRYADPAKNEYSRFNTWTGSAMDGQFEIEGIASGFRILFRFNEYDLTIPFEAVLADGALHCRIATDRIVSGKASPYLLSLALLPYFGAGEASEAGYLLVPDGSGGIIRFNRGKYTTGSYSRPVYGTELTERPIGIALDVEDESIRMPVFGIKRDGNAMLAILGDGAENAWITANGNVQITERANVYADFRLKATDAFAIGTERANLYEEGPIRIPSLSVQYRFLTGSEADYSGMAREYRRYLEASGGFTPQAAKAPALFADLYGAVVKPVSRMGIRMDSLVPLTTAAEVRQIVAALQEAGIEDVVVRYNGWNRAELNGRLPLSRSVASALGRKEFAALLEDPGFYPAIGDVLSYSRGRNPLSRFLDTACALSGVPVRYRDYAVGLGRQAGTSRYYLTAGALGDYVGQFSSQFATFPGLALSDIGHTIYNDYRVGSVKRTELRAILEGGLEDLAARTGRILLDNPNLYAARFADEILHAPTRSSGQSQIDEDVPFYGLVLGRYVRYAAESMNNAGPGRDNLLRMIENGTSPAFSFIYRSPDLVRGTTLAHLYSPDFRLWLDEAASACAAAREIFDAAGGEPMDSHEILSPGVRRIGFPNGAQVYVNYTVSEYVTESGDRVPAKGYLVKGGAA